MSSRFVQALRFDLHFSIGLFAFGLMVHLLAVTVLFLTDVPTILLITISVIIGSQTLVFILRNLPLISAEKQSLVLRSDGSGSYESAGEGWIEMVLLGNHYVSPFLIVIRFRSNDGRKRSILLLPWEYDGELIRRLRVFLYQAETTDSEIVPR